MREEEHRRTRPTGGARSLSRRQARMPASGHGPSARGAHPRGMVAPLEEVCFQPEAGSAICVQRFDDSLNSAIRTTYRISLRSSSLLMPRYPSTRVVCFCQRRTRGELARDPRSARAYRRPNARRTRVARGARATRTTAPCVTRTELSQGRTAHAWVCRGRVRLRAAPPRGGDTATKD